MNLMIQTKEYAGLWLVNEAWQQWQEQLALILKQNDLKLIFTPNPEQLILARKNPHFAALLKQADYLIPDGVGVVKAGGFKQRLTGLATAEYLLNANLIPTERILLIGGRYQQFASQGKLVIGQTQLYYTPGYQNAFLSTISETKSIQRLIANKKPLIVMVAFGAPMQEEFLVSQREFLERAGVKLALVVGGSFDVFLNLVPRAPECWQDLGLEWLWRLFCQPWRWRRQLALSEFLYCHYRFYRQQKKSTKC